MANVCQIAHHRPNVMIVNNIVDNIVDNLRQVLKSATMKTQNLALPAMRTTPLDIVHAVIKGLESGEFLPGGRLIEAELCLRFDIGRQVAREALQHLNARGIVELAPHRGAAIVRMTVEEAAQTLDVTELLFGLASRTAAKRIAAGGDTSALTAALHNIEVAETPLDFAAARRHFYGALAETAGNGELTRLLDQVRVHVLRAQFGFVNERQSHSRELAAIGRLVLAGKAKRAEESSRAHVRGIKERLTNF